MATRNGDYSRQFGRGSKVAIATGLKPFTTGLTLAVTERLINWNLDNYAFSEFEVSCFISKRTRISVAKLLCFQ